MVACKPEVLISQLVDEIETPFQGLYPIFGVEQPNSTIIHYTRHKGSPEIQDGGLLTGSILISQLVDKIETPFQGLSPLTELPKELFYPENEE